MRSAKILVADVNSFNCVLPLFIKEILSITYAGTGNRKVAKMAKALKELSDRRNRETDNYLQGNVTCIMIETHNGEKKVFG